MTGKFHYAIGWDVGAWHCDKGASRDAICVLRYKGKGLPSLVGELWRGNLRDIINAHHGPDLLREMLKCCYAPSADRPLTITLAIDAPLGWPGSFTNLLAGVTENQVPETKGENPLLLRETERQLWERGFKPLSAVQDMIGSQSTKGLQFLHRAGFQCQHNGIWFLDQGPLLKAKAIETYPNPAKTAPVVKRVFSKLRRSALLKKLPSSASPDSKDALLCAIVAFLYDKNLQALEAPKEVPPPGEGWIWLPSKAKPRQKKTLRSKGTP